VAFRVYRVLVQRDRQLDEEIGELARQRGNHRPGSVGGRRAGSRWRGWSRRSGWRRRSGRPRWTGGRDSLRRVRHWVGVRVRLNGDRKMECRRGISILTMGPAYASVEVAPRRR
jgi:hypothetical protein